MPKISCSVNEPLISLIRACVANEILKWVGCVRRGRGEAVLGIVGGSVTFSVLNGDSISDENMPFYIISLYIFFLFFPFKKSERPEIVAFNRIVVNYNVHFF